MKSKFLIFFKARAQACEKNIELLYFCAVTNVDVHTNGPKQDNLELSSSYTFTSVVFSSGYSSAISTSTCRSESILCLETGLVST